MPKPPPTTEPAPERGDAESTPAAAETGGRIESLSLAESASVRVAQLLHSGTYQPGQRLPSERKLAVELKISRSALREALRTLESAGLLEPRIGSGWYVTTYGGSDSYEAAPLTTWMRMQPVGDIVAVRRLLEPAAIHAIPAMRVRETAEALREVFDNMRRAFRAGHLTEACDHHTRFHWILVQYASTRLLRNLLASMIESVATAQLEVFRTPRAGDYSLAKHLAILEALERGDVEEAANRELDHLEPTFTFPTTRARSA